MNFLQRMLRNPPTGVLLILGLSVSCFVIINVTDLIGKVSAENKSVHSFSYIISSYLTTPDSEQGIDEQYVAELAEQAVSRLSAETSGNTYISDLQLSIDRQIDTVSVSLVIKQNEGLRLEYQSGGTPADMKLPNCVVIGESLKKFVVQENGKSWLTLGGNQMQVAGVLENKMAGGVDTSLYLLWENCDDSVRADLLAKISENLSALLNIQYKSQSDISGAYQAFIKDMEAISLRNIVLDAKYQSDYQNYWYRFYNSVFLSISLAFSIITSFSASYLWAFQRKRELAIRRAYGYDTAQIFALLLKDILKLSAFAVLLSVLMQGVYGLLFERTLLFGEQFWLQFPLICGGIFIVVLLNAANLMREVAGASPVTAISQS